MPITHEKRNTPLPENLAEDQPVIAINNLDFAYPDGHAALYEISLDIKKGEKVALVGPNGAGKSTLMLHLNGILKGAGELRVGGFPLNKQNLPVIRALVGLVFQNPDDQLFSPTVFEDVAFGPLHMGFSEDEVIARVEEALAQVDMSGFEKRLSHHLSTGQKKRIAIATVLSMHPQVLVLDEPSAGLDPRARRGLIQLLNTLPITMLVSTHDLRMASELFPRMVIMDEGRIVADGLTSTLLRDESLLEKHGLEKP
ncbi:MAG: ABC transporter ATP-binding protein [Anaerolineae bacterium]|jgi:cobalt/nickel transport system ATP-binding protein|nr:ABC transporter ATP-binding protein [Anaerolineae bacterium]MBT7069835.1 ABC transporter ATP-binding protein [Anaerolineae bacterium]MBT7325777.1 ABC transporter ATP-binding protein [Anaerolineae bacterium]